MDEKRTIFIGDLFLGKLSIDDLRNEILKNLEKEIEKENENEARNY